MDQPVVPGRRIEQPPYQKLSIILLGIATLIFGLHIGAAIIVPLMFAMLLAMLLNPMVNRMQKWRVPRVLAITIAVLVAMLALAGLAYFIGTQAAHFSETLPQLKEKLNSLGTEAQRWAQEAFNMRKREVTEAVEKVKNESMEKSGSLVGQTLTAVGTLFAFFFLLPVFTFLLLLYKRLLLTFISKLFPPKDHDVLQDVLKNTKGVVQSYLMGLILEAGIVAALNWAGLLIIGVEYALLLAVIGAVLNLIPYIGMMIATVLPMVIALATGDPSDALWVLALYAFVQFLDNNFIVPRVVASRVELNALVSILAVMVGGAVWGIPGMFLSIPLTAMLKVVFDRVPGLEPWGFLLGDDADAPSRSLLRMPQLHLPGKVKA